jgi:hypothetical protein
LSPWAPRSSPRRCAGARMSTTRQSRGLWPPAARRCPPLPHRVAEFAGQDPADYHRIDGERAHQAHNLPRPGFARSCLLGHLSSLCGAASRRLWRGDGSARRAARPWWGSAASTLAAFPEQDGVVPVRYLEIPPFAIANTYLYPRWHTPVSRMRLPMPIRSAAESGFCW